MDEVEEVTAPWYVWTGLSLIAAASFWCQAVVTEERFVPALNIISDYFSIPDDIAGATLMAAGASSPELFSSIVSLFVTHSSLGLGTIVGSEIFNQLIICAGAVYASKKGSLKLDRAIVMREVGFYALGIITLYIALQDSRPDESDDSGIEHIYISFNEACLVFSGYVLYVIVCANMDSVVACFTKVKEAGDSIRDAVLKDSKGYGAINTSKTNIEVGDMPFVVAKKVLSSEPSENWDEVDYVASARPGSTATNSKPDQIRREMGGSFVGSFLGNSIRSSIHTLGIDLVQHTEKPSHIHSLFDTELNLMEKRFSCFLWQKSIFYTKAYFGSNAWHLRWFDFTPFSIVSVPDRTDSEKHQMLYPRFKEVEVDEKHLLIKIVNPTPNKRNYTLMAPSKEIFDLVIEKLEVYMDALTSSRTTEAEKDDLLRRASTSMREEDFDDSDPYEDLIAFPIEGSISEIVIFLLLFPIRFLMHWTLPDVRHLDEDGNPTGTIGKAFAAAFMCLVWLIIGSYSMVASLEALAELMNIPDAVVGFTVSAAGTSLPNYVASKVAAENGFGNQAVSNAFGSNTFNIMIGLGLPWMLYTSVGTHFEPYHGLRNEGITESVLILALVLLVFIVLMFTTDFVLLKWHGNLFIGMYVAYIVFSIAQVYL